MKRRGYCYRYQTKSQGRVAVQFSVKTQTKINKYFNGKIYQQQVEQKVIISDFMSWLLEIELAGSSYKLLNLTLQNQKSVNNVGYKILL